MTTPEPRRPGDLILDRYMPDAPLDVREEARRRLYAYVRTLLRAAERMVREEQATTDSHDTAGCPRIPGQSSAP